MKTCAAALLALAAVVVPAAAEEGAPQGYTPPDIAEQMAKMAELDFLAGDWSGTGWVMNGPQKFEFAQTEDIDLMLGGRIMTIHGTGRAPQAPAEAPPTFEAFAVVSWNDYADAYEFRSYAQGHASTMTASVPEPGVFVWQSGPVTYSITVEGDTWTETGVRKGPDGEDVEFFGMTLTRQ